MLSPLEARRIESDARSGQPRTLHRLFRALTLVLGCLELVACGQVEGTPVASGEPVSGSRGRIVARTEPSSAPQGSDAPPQITLVLEAADGQRSELAGRYIDAVEFREGQAAVTLHRELVLVEASGSRSVLARELDGLPTRAWDGSLVYAARFGETVELYRLSVAGGLQRLASFHGSATRLAPQTDGSVVFVGARSGGVSGVWIADDRGARCLTNCDLRVGKPWGDRYRALPGDVESMRIVGGQVEWLTPEGNRGTTVLEKTP